MRLEEPKKQINTFIKSFDLSTCLSPQKTLLSISPVDLSTKEHLGRLRLMFPDKLFFQASLVFDLFKFIKH